MTGLGGEAVWGGSGPDSPQWGWQGAWWGPSLREAPWGGRSQGFITPVFIYGVRVPHFG